MLIGEAPGRHGDPARPLDGRCGEVLCRLAGWTVTAEVGPLEVLSARFWVTNLLDAYPGPDGKGTAWPAELAKQRASVLLPRLRRCLTAVLLGRRVAHAFGITNGTWAAWREPDECVPTRHVVIPHPSGINRTLNDPAVRHAAGVALRLAATRPPKGTR